MSLLLVGGLAACGAERSVQAYCETMEEHKQRYLAAMGVANSQAAEGDLEGILSGLAGGISALGDLAQMWEELADVAPEEIRADVETVRDSYNEQLDIATGSAANPLEALASGLASSMLSAGAWTRVDDWTADNCGVAGEAIMHDESDDEFSEEAAPEETEMAPMGPGIDEPIELYGEWHVMGNALLNANGHSVFLPGHGELAIDVAAILAPDEVVDASVTVVDHDDQTIVAALALVRTPADGLNPAEFEVRLVALDPATWSVLGDFPLPDGVAHEDGDALRLNVVSAPDGLVLIHSWDHGPTVAVDPLTGAVAWQHDGVPAEAHQVFRQPKALLGDYIETDDGWTCATFTLVDIASGDVEWELDRTSPDLESDGSDCPELLATHSAELVGGRYYTLDAMYGDDRLVVDLRTGSRLSTEIDWESVVDPTGDLVALTRTALYADDPGVTIVDTGTGESLLHVDGERMQELDLWVYAIYDEQLYVSTTDGQPIIDAHTGDQVGEWTEYPIGVVNGWTVVSTGSGYRADPPR